jgi:uncharacterized protein YerC
LPTIEETRAKLADYIRNNPAMTYRHIAVKLGCSVATISSCARDHGIKRQPRIVLDLSKLGVE